jgi:hypothetical protein
MCAAATTEEGRSISKYRRLTAGARAWSRPYAERPFTKGEGQQRSGRLGALVGECAIRPPGPVSSSLSRWPTPSRSEQSTLRR